MKTALTTERNMTTEEMEILFPAFNTYILNFVRRVETEQLTDREKQEAREIFEYLEKQLATMCYMKISEIVSNSLGFELIPAEHVDYVWQSFSDAFQTAFVAAMNGKVSFDDVQFPGIYDLYMTEAVKPIETIKKAAGMSAWNLLVHEHLVRMEAHNGKLSIPIDAYQTDIEAFDKGGEVIGEVFGDFNKETGQIVVRVEYYDERAKTDEFAQGAVAHVREKLGKLMEKEFKGK